MLASKQTPVISPPLRDVGETGAEIDATATRKDEIVALNELAARLCLLTRFAGDSPRFLGRFGIHQIELKLSSAVLEPLVNAVATGDDNDSLVTRKADFAARDKWQQVIDYQLAEWGSNPSRFEDEGVEPPSVAAIRRAIHVAEQFRDAGLQPPTAVVLDPNGGVVFERRVKDLVGVIHFWDDGSVEFRRYQGTHLVERQRF